jgi:hypothetical protein
VRFPRHGLVADDHALVAREPGLPGLALMLDDAAFGAALAEALPEAEIAAVRAEYVRYKPGTSCLVGYRALDRFRRHTHVYARAHRPGNADKLDPDRHDSVILEDAGVAVHLFPADRRLRTLARVVRDADVATLRYKPERRWVGRVGARVVRVYEPSRFQPAAHAALALGAKSDLPVAGRTRVDTERCAVSAAWVPGVTLDAQLGTAAAVDSAREAGAVLAALHVAEVPRLAAAPSPVPALDGAARAIAALVPEVGDRAAAVRARLAPRAENMTVSHPVHGDFSADQVVLGPGGARLLDLDAAALGDPLDDLASFAAELELRVAEGTLGAAAAAVTCEALLEGYGDAGGETPRAGDERLVRATARALLLRAADPFRTRHPAWGEAIERAVARVEALARGGATAGAWGRVAGS